MQKISKTETVYENWLFGIFQKVGDCVLKFFRMKNFTFFFRKKKKKKKKKKKLNFFEN